MILPIRVFGDPILREKTKPVTDNSDELQTLIDNMIETMNGASGIGLAAPQIGRQERLFIVDVSPMFEEDEDGEAVDLESLPDDMFWAKGPIAFINPEISEFSDEEWEFEEGCLSIPDIREGVYRPEGIRIKFLDRHFVEHDLVFDDMMARVIQHEFDHLNGVLFLDHLSGLRRRLLKRKLNKMKNGDVEADYPLAI